MKKSRLVSIFCFTLLLAMTMFMNVTPANAFELDPGSGGGISDRYTYTQGLTGSCDYPEGFTVARVMVENSDAVIGIEARLVSVATYNTAGWRVMNLQIMTFYTWKGHRYGYLDPTQVPIQERAIGSASDHSIQMKETTYSQRYNVKGIFRNDVSGDRVVWPEGFAKYNEDITSTLIKKGFDSIVGGIISLSGLGKVGSFAVSTFANWAYGRIHETTRTSEDTGTFGTAKLMFTNYDWPYKCVEYPDNKNYFSYDVVGSYHVAFLYNVNSIPYGSYVGLKFSTNFGYDLGWGDSGSLGTSWVTINILMN